MKLATTTLLLTICMSSMSFASAQCEVQDRALEACLDQFLWSDEACETCLDQAALQNAGGQCGFVQSNVCGQINSRCQGVCGAGMQGCASQINSKVNCELNDQRTTELRLGTCSVSCDGPNVSNTQSWPSPVAAPVPTWWAPAPVPVRQPIWSWPVSAPTPTLDATSSSSNVWGDECFQPDTNLGACLDNLFGVDEAACESCVDNAALRLTGGSCGSAFLCTEMHRCSSQCGGYSCWNQILAKATCERNNERNTELRLDSCPSLTCSAGNGSPTTSGGSVSSSSSSESSSGWGRSWTWFDQPSGEASSSAVACTSILAVGSLLFVMALSG